MKAIDMHCDTIAKIYEHPENNLRENSFQIDLQKLRQGDYLLQNFALFVDAKQTADPLKTALEMTDLYYRELEKNADWVKPIFSYSDIMENQKNGFLSAMLTLEEGAVLQGNLSHLRNFYRLGVRMIALTWNYPNEIGYPNMCFENDFPNLTLRNEKGLTPAGIEIVQEMERLGMIIDVSHMSDGGFYDVLKYTSAPFVASHSNSAAECNVCRNLTDPMIRALAERGGVTGLNFCTDFLITPTIDFEPTNSMHIAPDSDNKCSMLKDMVRHVRHITDVGGIEVCGLGTDFDGIGNGVEFKHAGGIGALADALHMAGFSWDAIDKIFYKNVLRLYKDIL